MTTESIAPRMDYRKVAPEAIRALAAVERYARLACEHFEERELVDLTMAVLPSTVGIDWRFRSGRLPARTNQRRSMLPDRS